MESRKPTGPGDLFDEVSKQPDLQQRERRRRGGRDLRIEVRSSCHSALSGKDVPLGA
jgi:hypothetical protein